MSEYVNPDGTPWVPAFEGQRPPFQPGNKLAVGHNAPMVHGARSPRMVTPISRRIRKETLAIPELDYLDAPVFRELFGYWCDASARLELVSEAVARTPFEQAATTPEGRPLLEYERQLMSRVDFLANRLGMTPTSASDLTDEIRDARAHVAKVQARRQDKKDLHAALVEGLREWANENRKGDE